MTDGITTFDFVCVGSATEDVFVSSDASKVIAISDVQRKHELLCFDYGGKLNVDHIEFTTGGGATNAAVSLSRLGAKCAFLGMLGTDQVARLVLDELDDHGIDTSYRLTSETEPTGYSVILTSFKGDRTVLVHRGANEQMSPDQIDWSFVERTDWIYLTSLSGRSADLLAPLVEKASAAGVRIAINPGSTQLRAGIDGLADVLEATTVLLLNKEEAAELSGKPPARDVIIESRCDLCGTCVEVCPAGALVEHHGRIVSHVDLCDRCGLCMPACPQDAIAMEPWTFNVTEAFDALKKAGPDVVVITDGEKGAQATDGETLFLLPAAKAKVASTLGAGDAFGSAFTFEYARSGDIARALALGTANAASVIRQIGAKNDLLDAEAAKAELAAFDESKLRRHPFQRVLESARPSD